VQKRFGRLLGHVPMPPPQIYPKTYPTLSHLSLFEPKLQCVTPLRFLEIPRPKPVTFSVLKCSKWLALDLGSKWQKSTLTSNMSLLYTSCFANVQPPIRILAIPRPKPVTFSVIKCSKWLVLDLGSKCKSQL